MAALPMMTLAMQLIWVKTAVSRKKVKEGKLKSLAFSSDQSQFLEMQFASRICVRIYGLENRKLCSIDKDLLSRALHCRWSCLLLGRGFDKVLLAHKNRWHLLLSTFTVPPEVLLDALVDLEAIDAGTIWRWHCWWHQMLVSQEE